MNILFTLIELHLPPYYSYRPSTQTIQFSIAYAIVVDEIVMTDSFTIKNL